jgi:hypothetical protein
VDAAGERGVLGDAEDLRGPFLFEQLELRCCRPVTARADADGERLGDGRDAAVVQRFQPQPGPDRVTAAAGRAVPGGHQGSELKRKHGTPPQVVEYGSAARWRSQERFPQIEITSQSRLYAATVPIEQVRKTRQEQRGFRPGGVVGVREQHGFGA